MCWLLSSMTANGFAAQLFYEVFGILWNKCQRRQFGAVFAIKSRTEREMNRVKTSARREHLRKKHEKAG